MVSDEIAAKRVIDGINAILDACAINSAQDAYVVYATIMQTAASVLEEKLGNQQAMDAVAQILGEMAPRSNAYKVRLAEWEAKRAREQGRTQ